MSVNNLIKCHKNVLKIILMCRHFLANTVQFGVSKILWSVFVSYAAFIRSTMK